jgi:hypothetical protein
MRHPRRLGLLSIAGLVFLSSACQQAAQEQKAAPVTQPAPSATPAPPATPAPTTVSDEARIRAALEPLAAESRQCYPLLVALNAALSARKNETKAAEAFNACQAPVNQKTLAIVQELKKGGLKEDRILTVVNQWRNEQMSGKAGRGGGGAKK